jgi:clan AA aspartic protease (TIGR02281 family)
MLSFIRERESVPRPMNSIMHRLVLSLFALVVIPFNTFATPAEEDEAKVFFNQILQQTSNPIIASLAKSTLSRLDRVALPESSHTNAPVEINLISQLSGSYAVPVLFQKNVMGTFIIDTGATYTVITPRMAQRLGITIDANTPRLTMLTANGQIRVPKVQIPQLSLGGLVIHNVEAVVQPLGNDPMLAGLLGLNCFKHLEMTVRADKLILNRTQISRAE